jgi:predicted nucleic acid-binding protein
MQKYLFDSCAMIGFFEKEAGAEKVKGILTEASQLECIVLMHNASVAEVYYDAIRSAKQTHDAILGSLNSYPIIFIDRITTDMIKWMGYFKTSYKISFADSIVLAAAKLNNAKVVTSDHHEFDVIEKSGDVAFEWIR